MQRGAVLLDTTMVNEMLPHIETSHQIQFKKKPVLAVFRDEESYLRLSPTRARFCAFPSGCLVVSPRAQQEDQQGVISLRIYIEHELSHLLLFQNMDLLSYFCFPDWLLEGWAVYTSGQRGTSWYPDSLEVCEMIRAGNFMPPAYFKTRHEKEIELDVEYPIAFMYSECACFVEYLITEFGKTEVLGFIHDLLYSRNWRDQFQCSFGRTYDEVEAAFRTGMVD